MAAPKSKIEFLPREEWEKKSSGRFLKWVLGIGRHIVIAVELVVILAFISRFKFDRELTDLNEEVKQQQAIVESSVQFEQEFRFLQKRIETVAELRKSQLEAEKILNELSGLVPTDVFLSDFSIVKDEVRLTATTLSEAGLATFLENLNSSPRFENLFISQLVSGEKKGVGIAFSLTSGLKR